MGRSRQHSTVAHGLPEFVKGMFDFDSWAPKSTRIWRLQQYEYPSDDDATSSQEQEDVDVLQKRVNEMRRAEGSPSSSDSSNDRGAATVVGNSTASFSDAEDDAVAAALNQRLREIATVTADPELSAAVPAAAPPLTADELRKLIFTKYGKTCDMSFVRRDLPGKTFVGLNVMWTHLEQRSFQMTEEQYMEKLDGVAAMLDILQRSEKVRSFLQAPARSQNGLPRRPVVGTAITIPLELDKAVIEEWFGAGFQ